MRNANTFISVVFTLFIGCGILAAQGLPDMQQMADAKLKEAKSVLVSMDEKLSGLDSMLTAEGGEIPDGTLEEIVLLSKQLNPETLSMSDNVFMIFAYKKIYVWLHASEPYEWTILNPIKPITEGIYWSLSTVKPKQLPIIFVFGHYSESVYLLPKLTTPVALIGVGATISGVGDAAFKVTYDMTLPKVYNSRYSMIANFEIFNCNRDYGGAAYINNSKVLFLMNKIHDCSANIMGGGICCVADISVPLYMGVNPLIFCNEIWRCSAPQGGGIVYLKDGQSISVGNKVHHCSANDNGGGVHFEESGCYFIGNSIYNNTTSGHGGGVSINNSGKVIMSANTIMDNSSPGNGGGIWITNGGMIPPVIVWNQILKNTASIDGGGIYVDKEADAVIMLNMPIDGNTAQRGGGIALFDGEITTSILGNTISNNTADYGGGIWASNFDNYIAVFNKIEKNKANIFGGGIYLEGGDTKVYQSRIVGNEAILGGGIYAVGNNKPEFWDLRLKRNKADDGAGIYLVDGSNPDIEKCGFEDNIAQNRGGGLYLNKVSSPGIKEECKFMGNEARFGGGLFFENETTPYIDDNTFQGNKAKNGGGIYVGDKLSAITNNRFIGNHSSGNGGAIYVPGGMTPQIFSNQFHGNIAGSNSAPTLLVSLQNEWTAAKGGAIYSFGNGADPEITSNLFKWNEAMFGGAVAIADSSKPDIHSNDYIENLGGLSEPGEAGVGGGLYVEDTEIEILESYFVGNYARHGAGAACVKNSIVDFKNNNFWWNVGDIDSSGIGKAGGIYGSDEGTIIQIGKPDSSNFFKENFSAYGGGMAAENSCTITAHSNTFTANRAGYNTNGDGGAVHVASDKTILQLGGNAAESLGNLFMQNTAGSKRKMTYGNGGALAVADNADTKAEGNRFFDHNAANRYGGSVYVTGSGSFAEIGGFNEDIITNEPFPTTQFGNIIQNNNRAMNAYPRYREGPGEMPEETVDTLFCELEEEPEWPDTTEEIIIYEYDRIPTLTVTPELAYQPGMFVYLANGNAGVTVLDATDPFNIALVDTLPTAFASYDTYSWDHKLFIADGELGVRIFDVMPLSSGDPPEIQDTISIGSAKIIDITGLLNFVYALDEGGIIHVLECLGDDVSLADEFVLPGIESRTVAGIESNNNLIFAVLTDNIASEFFALGPDGTSLQVLGNFVFNGAATAFHVTETDAFIAYSHEEGDDVISDVIRLDITNPSSIQDVPIDPFESEDPFASVAAELEHIYLGTNDGFRRYGLYDGTDAFFPTGSGVLDIEVYEQGAFCAQGYDGFGLYNKTDGSEASSYDAPEENTEASFGWPKFVPWDEEEGPDTTWSYQPPEHPDTVECDDSGIIVQDKPGDKKLSRINPGELERSYYVYDVVDTIITRSGGAIAVTDNADADILGNLLGGLGCYDGNKATEFGGAVYIYKTGGVEIGRTEGRQEGSCKNFILGNIAHKGGAISINQSSGDSVYISNCNIGGPTDIQSNLAHWHGGGVYLDTAKVSISENIIHNNYCGIDSIPNKSLEGFGGGIAMLNSNAEVRNNWIIGNVSIGNAAGIGIAKNPGRIVFKKNTFSENYGIKSKIEVVDDTSGLGNDLFIAQIRDSLIIERNIFDHFGTYQSYSIYADSSRDMQDNFVSYVDQISFRENNVYNNTGYRYGGLLDDQTGNGGNISSHPLFIDPSAGNYCSSNASPSPDMGWNPFTGDTKMSSNVFNVPGDYSKISVAMGDAKYGDKIIVHPNYDSEGETFPITMKDGVVLTGRAFERPDLNIVPATVIEGNGQNIIEMTDAGPRTALCGFTIKAGDFGVLVNRSCGLIAGNLLYDNNMGIGVGFLEDTSGMSDRFRDKLFIDHNTIQDGTVFSYDTLKSEKTDYGFILMNKLQFGPIFSYNISSAELNIKRSGDPSINNYIQVPPIHVTFERNDFWPENLRGYYDDIPDIAENNLRVADPAFAGFEDDYHLMSGSPCILVDSTITETNDTLVFMKNFTGLIGAQYSFNKPYFFADTLQGPPGLAVEFTDTSWHTLPYARKTKTWYFGDGDEYEFEAPAYPYSYSHNYDSAGTYDVTLEIADRYQIFRETKTQYINADTSWVHSDPGKTVNLRSVFFADAMNGWIAGSGGIILASDDGGITWIDQSENTFIIGSVRSDGEGWAKAKLELVRPDKDADKTLTPITTDDLNSIFFLNGSLGFVAGANGTILKTTNAGSKWSLLNTATNDDINSIFFIDSHKGWAGTAAGAVLKTGDGGESWERTVAAAEGLNAICFISESRGWACGENGLIIETSDGGASWQLLEAGITNNLNDIHFANVHTGWACGDDGNLFKTNDRGDTWTPSDLPTSENLKSILFTDDYYGWVCGEAGRILRTYDGGESWQSQYSGTLNNLLGIFFTDENNGWACGTDGTVLRTVNGGKTVGVGDSPEDRLCLEVFPNPFGRKLHIRYYLDEPALVELSLVNSLGVEAVKTSGGFQGTGLQKMELGTAGIAPGVYVLRLSAELKSGTLVKNLKVVCTR